MAFANGFNGDNVSLGYILKTLNAKTYLIPGITCNPDVSVTAAGESAYYYKRSASSVAAALTGARIAWGDGNSKGVTRTDISMVNCFQIKDAIPHANFATVSADVIGDKVVQESIEVANQHNAAAITKMETTTYNKTLGAALSLNTIYSEVLTAKAEFITQNKAKYLKPTAIFVAPDVMALLKEKNLVLFKDSLPGQSEKIRGYFDDMAVIECPDVAATTAFIMVNDLGFGAPINVNTLYVVDGTAAGWAGGTLISGELSYGFDLCDADLVYLVKKAQ